MTAWRPSASLNNLKLRANLLNKIRQFFFERDVLEVETPLLCHSTATDPGLASFETNMDFSGEIKPLYLQTSPEFPMKRLLAAGYGSIYQICKAFRKGEVGERHNPEFTLLEWYRVGFDHFELMDEMDQLLAFTLNTTVADRISYRELFDEFCSVNPHTCDLDALEAIVKTHGITFNYQEASRDVWLDLIMTHVIEPHLGKDKPLFVYDYPSSQAALAKTKQEAGYSVGQRFEVYYKSIELANGYYELADANEQRTRFEEDNAARLALGLPTIPIDQFLLEALPSLPPCAGVALGFDRLLCLILGSQKISDVLNFPIFQA